MAGTPGAAGHSQPGRASSSSAASNPAPECTYTPAPGFRPPPGYADPSKGRPGAWYTLHCQLITEAGMVWLPAPRAARAAVSVAVLAERAQRELVLPRPDIRTSPTVGLVNLPTWLWVGAWQPKRATARVPGVSVTATATPVSVFWQTGDGASLTCRGPGTAWNEALPAEAASPTCGHTYRAPSPRSGLLVRATIHWSLTWAGAGHSGVLDGLTTTSTIRVAVIGLPVVVTTP
jgi:hypothetical protein